MCGPHSDPFNIFGPVDTASLTWLAYVVPIRRPRTVSSLKTDCSLSISRRVGMFRNPQ